MFAGSDEVQIGTAYRGDLGKAVRYSSLAFRFLEKFDANDLQARVVMTIYGSVYPLKHSYRKLLGPLQDAHRVGLVFGDLHVSAIF